LESSRRKRIVAVALIGAALTSFAVAGFSLAASSSAGQYKTGVFAKVYDFGDWIYVDNTTYWEELISISLPNVPVNAYYYVVCDGYAAMQNSACLWIAISVDGIPEGDDDGTTSRFYRYPDMPSVYTGIHTERLYYLDAGPHTFHFIAKLYWVYPGGEALINYHTITVVVFTDGGLIELVKTSVGSAETTE